MALISLKRLVIIFLRKQVSGSLIRENGDGKIKFGEHFFVHNIRNSRGEMFRLVTELAKSGKSPARAWNEAGKEPGKKEMDEDPYQTKLPRPRKSYWIKLKPLLVILLPIFLAPIPIVLRSSEARYAYCLMVIAIFWILELMPINAVSFLPMVLMPILGIAEPKKIAPQYLPDNNMLVIGNYITACGIKATGIHNRIALNALKLCGASVAKLLLALMIITFFLSMWMSNSACSALMYPIVETIINFLEEAEAPVFDGKEKDKNPAKSDELINKTKMLSMAVCYAAGCGGIACTTGTAGTLITISLLEERFPCMQPKLNFAVWLIYAGPFSLVLMGVVYFYLRIYWMGFRSLLCWGQGEEDPEVVERNEKMKVSIAKHHAGLEPVKSSEIYWG